MKQVFNHRFALLLGKLSEDNSIPINIRIFDYAKFTEPYRDELKQNAQDIADRKRLTYSI